MIIFFSSSSYRTNENKRTPPPNRSLSILFILHPKSKGYVESKMFLRKKKWTKIHVHVLFQARKEHLSPSLISVLFLFFSFLHLKPLEWIPKNKPLPIVHTEKKKKKNKQNKTKKHKTFRL